MIRHLAGNLSLLRGGSGALLVLLHPLALAGQLWRPLAAKLDGFDILAVDLRGHGESPWDGKPFSIEDMADDLGVTLDVLGLDEISLLGMSMGGSVAMTFAGKYPERVRSLVLADTTAWYGENAPTAWAQRAAKAADTARADQLPFQLDRWFSPGFRESHPDEVDRVCEIFLHTDSHAHAAASVAMGELDARPLLFSVRAKTLVLAGEHDYATPPSMAGELAGAIPGATLEILPALRHLSLVEKPELAETIHRHLTETA
ncbi:alpha/beta hydrolase [Amycolatopsis acidiphila]|uniref:Alpha/beta fold hydrolase n=1 Tax=Amycolatopsis acidiphila TaxID=715473 RepID=A0A558A642_9PSEU|nr:alpha/beta fold hydrolase [Amycolatopsis acidiphila]TVT19739.1 alpha/beta fold hydrolase [Amycolatopsis acidiphila]UIJ61902.1 alpha/beta hydrolase [Amycolatopsis acidiphila]GHG57263.1 lactone hydrolase [Amycolatopsis acidiphila]